jgi:hypothetical protein
MSRVSFESPRELRWAGAPRALIAVALAGLAVWPVVTTRLAARHAASRLDALVASPFAGAAVCGLDPTLSLRVRQLGALLAGWETIGGCGAGGATDSGAGVRWMGHNVTGGLFNSLSLLSFINHFHTGSYDVVLNEQLTRDFTPKLNAGVIVPVLYKMYKDFGGLQGTNVSNSGIGDMALVGSYKLGPINATTVTAKLGLPTGTWNASYMGTVFTPDQQLGFGKVTGGLILEHTFDQTWGLVLVGGSANYRGGNNGIAYRGPGAVAYGFAGYFLGPLVPAVGLQIAGLKQQDTRGAFGENLDSPVLTSAINASIEWSTDYVAVLLGTSIPLALQDTWGKSGKFAVQPYIIGLGVSVSPF